MIIVLKYMKHNLNNSNTTHWYFNGIQTLCTSSFKLTKPCANAEYEYVLVLAEDGYK